MGLPDVWHLDEGLPEPFLDIVRFCAIECSLQVSGENSVSWMVNAWSYALKCPSGVLTEATVIAIGRAVEPDRNARGYRECGVRVGDSIKPHQREVPELMRRLMAQVPAAVEAGEQAEWYRQFEEVHPFVDGNGRTGQVLYNLLCGTLHDPEFAPDYWGDWRRKPGFGAPSEPATPDRVGRSTALPASGSRDGAT